MSDALCYSGIRNKLVWRNETPKASEQKTDEVEALLIEHSPEQELKDLEALQKAVAAAHSKFHTTWQNSRKRLDKIPGLKKHFLRYQPYRKQ